MENALPPIPAKRYFTIGEVSELCGVKPYVLRYWEQEFSQLKPMKRRGNRRYYQHHEVLLIRRIRELLYDQGFTISGARNQLGDPLAARGAAEDDAEVDTPEDDDLDEDEPAANAAEPMASMRPSRNTGPVAATSASAVATGSAVAVMAASTVAGATLDTAQLRAELLSIRALLAV